MVFNSIFVILGITAALLVLSLQLFFRSKKKPKSFGVYFLIPICVALMALYGLGLGLHNELEYQNAIREQREFLTDFADDYEYYLESYKKILDFYNELDSEQKEDILKANYNFEPTLDASRLHYGCRAGDTFAIYFRRNYVSPYQYDEYDDEYITKIVGYDNTGLWSDITLSVYVFSSRNYSTPNFLYPENYQNAVKQLQNLNQRLEHGFELKFYGQHDLDESTPFSITEYIIMLVYVALIWLFAVATMIMVFVKGGNNAMAAVEQNSGTATQPTAVDETPAPPKLKWEELSQDEQKPYLENAIKELYENQLKDTSLLGLSRQQIAMREYALHNKQFYLEDLTETEALGIQKTARDNYESGKPLSKLQGQKIEIPPESNKSILKRGFKWFIYNCMITTRNRQLNTKTTTFKSNGYGGIALEQKDNSNKASLIRPCGKCMSVSGEKPLDFVVGFNPFKKVFYCCGTFKGFSFVGDDILQYRVLSSNSKSEKYELIHKTGKKIMLSFNPIGSELLEAILGPDKFVG